DVEVEQRPQRRGLVSRLLVALRLRRQGAQELRLRLARLVLVEEVAALPASLHDDASTPADVAVHADLLHGHQRPPLRVAGLMDRNVSGRGSRKLIPDRAIEQAPARCGRRTAPLLEMERHARSHALIANLTRPLRTHRAMARSGLAADDEPFDIVERE